MEKDTLITLEDGTEYALLDETKLDERKFFFAVKVDKKGNPTTEYEIFEEFKDGEDVYMDTLEDGDLKKAITVDFTNNYMHMVGELIEDADSNTETGK